MYERTRNNVVASNHRFAAVAFSMIIFSPSESQAAPSPSEGTSRDSARSAIP